MNALTSTLLSAAAIAVATAGASAQRALLFTPSTVESTRSGSNGTSLAALRPNGVAVVVPNAATPFSAETFAHGLAVQTLAGDEDGDNDTFSPNFGGGIDAMLVTPWDFDPAQGYRPRQLPVSYASVYFSPAADIGTNVSGAPGLRRGDCGRFTRTPAGNGRVDHFLTAEQIISALGLFDPATNLPLNASDIDLDAITVTPERDIFLSLDADHAARLRVGPGAGVPTNFLLADGAIAVIPASAWTPNARGNVGAVTTQRGMIAFSEFDVHNLMVAAQATNLGGACTTNVLDTEGLAVDFDGGSFPITWGGQVHTFRDLLITTESLTGGGVIATRGIGSIAIVNGRALATGCGAGPTTGQQVGIMPSATVGYLAAIEALPNVPEWFTIGSPSAVPLGGALQLDIGTSLTAPFAFLGLSLGQLPVASSQSFAAWSPNNLGFPELYGNTLANPFLAIPMNASIGDGRFGSLSLPNSPAIPLGILFQAITWTPNGVLHLSTPITLH